MDFIAAILVPKKTFDNLKKRNDEISNFTEVQPSVDAVSEQKKQEDIYQTMTMLDMLIFIMGVAIGLYAAYLSFTCNTKMRYNMSLKVIFAIFAYIFGLVYLVLYLIMRWDVCRQL